MFDVTKTQFRRTATALVGAAIFSATALVAAVGPARAATPVSATDAWKAKVESELVGNMVNVRHGLNGDHYAIATVLVDVDRAGQVTGARVLRSTGSAGLDKQALRRARTVDFPATPSGKAVHVQMNLVFGQSERAVARALAELERPVVYASTSVDGSSNNDGERAQKTGM